MANKKQTPTNSPEEPRGIKKRISDQKKHFLEMLEKVPVINVACKRSGISRATLYRWKDQDEGFALIVSNKLAEGVLSINDLAKSKLIELISQGNLSASIFWLKTHDSEFVEKRSMSIEHYNKTTQPISEDTVNSIKRAFGNYVKGVNRISKLKQDRRTENT